MNSWLSSQARYTQRSAGSSNSTEILASIVQAVAVLVVNRFALLARPREPRSRRWIGGHEDFLPTQSCAGAVERTAVFDASALGLSYLFHRTHHDKLERIPMLFMGEKSAQGIVFPEGLILPAK